MGPSSLQLLGSAPNVRISSVQVGLDVVQLLALGLDQYGHVQEHLVQLLEILLHLLHSIMPLLNLVDSVQHSSPPLLLDGLLQECLALTCA